jgi:Mn2+/Fe2+ NRAMP family transporter
MLTTQRSITGGRATQRTTEARFPLPRPGENLRMRINSLLGLVYLVIGILVASTHDYFEHLRTAKALISAVLAVILWPLVLLSVNLHIH